MDIETVPVNSPTFEAVRRIRYVVFVDEQGVDPLHEFDATDDTATHFLAYFEGLPSGTARLYGVGDAARIGRVAVLAPFRRHGVGGALVLRALEEAHHRGFHDVMLHSQVAAVPFYARLGFNVEGEEFLEEGIRHVTMRHVRQGG